MAFIGVSWLGKVFIEKLPLNELFTGGLGMFIYVALVTLNAIIIAPVGIIPFIPLATGIWGMIPTALFNIVGWTIGSGIAFLLARIFGSSLIARLVGTKNLSKIELFLPQRRLFWDVVLLRIVLPVDFLSYALGLFSTMRFSSYMIATLIGVAPFSFIFSYAAILRSEYQLVVGAVIITFVIIVNVLLARQDKRLNNNTTDQKSIVMYYWGGEKFGFKIKNSCEECDINHGILDDMKQKEFNGLLVNIISKPWLTNFWESLAYGGWHAPIVIVNDRLFSQGIVIDRKKLSEAVLVT